MGTEAIKALNEYISDYILHFDHIPMEFEFEDVVYEYDDFSQYITN
tara:strand:+ start:2249 stop:2386 length:138 start_codon:yes stop_codon:yes gene_type:complete